MFPAESVVFCSLLALLPGLATGQCCARKEVSGETYRLASTSKPVPDFCLGGCIYTKENDPSPGTSYCFREGEGIATCRDGDCGNSEKWIKQYFEEECSAKINSFLQVDVFEQAVFHDELCVPPLAIINATVLLFNNPMCKGEPIQGALTRPTDNITYSAADFFVKTENISPWSVATIKEGFISRCDYIGILKPFTENRRKVSILAIKNNNNIIPTSNVNFTFEFSNQLLPDVFIQGNPTTCTKMYQPEPGSFQALNGKCFPTCRYAAWETDVKRVPCPCKGIIGGGINISDISLPSEQETHGKANLTGSFYFYQDTLIPPEWVLRKFSLTYAEFIRRNSDTVRVCESNLEIAGQFLFPTPFPLQVSMKVPCFAAQIPPALPAPPLPPAPTDLTGNPVNFTHSPFTHSPNQTHIGKDRMTLESEFSDVEGVLVFGGGDRFWMAACEFVQVNLFTPVDPFLTPQFCGCILVTLGQGFGIATKDQVKMCYIEALQAGPNPKQPIPASRFINRQFGNKNNQTGYGGNALPDILTYYGRSYA